MLFQESSKYGIQSSETKQYFLRRRKEQKFMYVVYVCKCISWSTNVKSHIYFFYLKFKFIIINYYEPNIYVSDKDLYETKF